MSELLLGVESNLVVGYKKLNYLLTGIKRAKISGQKLDTTQTKRPFCAIVQSFCGVDIYMYIVL